MKSIVSTSTGGLLQMLKNLVDAVVLIPTEINQTSRCGDVLLNIEDLYYYIHYEFQATSDPDMDFRIHDYNFRYRRNYYPVSLLPFAPLFDKGTKHLPSVIKRIKERIDKEATPEESEELWAHTLFLLGLKEIK